ncbi:MAG: type II secretion system protein [Patescibacteria group bacterium]
MKLFKNNQKGFTLIELLVVIGILAVLLAITLIAINPARQFAQANNTQRSSDVNAILNTIHQQMVDNKGLLTTGLVLGDVDKPISSAVGGTGVAFCGVLVPTYIAAFPRDPQLAGTWTDCTTYDTGYTISVSTTNNRLTIKAPTTQVPPAVGIITVTR